jgi:hypothetical protein
MYEQGQELWGSEQENVKLKGKSRVTDGGTGAGRNQWKKLLQNTSKFTPDYTPSHSGRQSASFTVSTVISLQLTHFMSLLFTPHQLNLFYKE